MFDYFIENDVNNLLNTFRTIMVGSQSILKIEQRLSILTCNISTRVSNIITDQCEPHLMMGSSVRSIYIFDGRIQKRTPTFYEIITKQKHENAYTISRYFM